MQPIPVKVKNVTIYAHFNAFEPLQEVILEGASGTYSVGTLLRNSYYNLDIKDEGTKKNPLSVHGKYYAVCETEDGDKFTTPWMYCLTNGAEPTFGRTISLLLGNGAQDPQDVGVVATDSSQFIKLGALTDITVSQLFPAPAIGQRTLITNGEGFIIATKLGTPHEMGVQVDSGTKESSFSPGAKNIIISGKTKEGKVFSQTGYTVISNGKPAIFLQEFWGK